MECDGLASLWIFRPKTFVDDACMSIEEENPKNKESDARPSHSKIAHSPKLADRPRRHWITGSATTCFRGGKSLADVVSREGSLRMTVVQLIRLDPRKVKCDQWTRSLSKSFLSWIQKQKSERTGKRLAPIACRRIMDSVKRAARWIHRQRPFLAGFPFQDVKVLKVDEPDWKGLSDVEVRRLKAAAEQLIQIETRTNQVPRRNWYIAVLFFINERRNDAICVIRFKKQQNRGAGSNLAPVVPNCGRCTCLPASRPIDS